MPLIWVVHAAVEASEQSEQPAAYRPDRAVEQGYGESGVDQLTRPDDGPCGHHADVGSSRSESNAEFAFTIAGPRPRLDAVHRERSA
jgi:hypothetical protein